MKEGWKIHTYIHTYVRPDGRTRPVFLPYPSFLPYLSYLSNRHVCMYVPTYLGFLSGTLSFPPRSPSPCPSLRVLCVRIFCCATEHRSRFVSHTTPGYLTFANLSHQVGECVRFGLLAVLADLPPTPFLARVHFLYQVVLGRHFRLDNVYPKGVRSIYYCRSNCVIPSVYLLLLKQLAERTLRPFPG